jgi:hypothetical protein
MINVDLLSNDAFEVPYLRLLFNSSMSCRSLPVKKIAEKAE